MTLAGLCVIVLMCGLAVFLVSPPDDLRDDFAALLPLGAESLSENTLRTVWLAGAPLLAIAWHRRRGARGILGGLVGGSICHGVYIIVLRCFYPRPDRIPLVAEFLGFSFNGATVGVILGLAAWGTTALASVAGANHARRGRTWAPDSGGGSERNSQRKQRQTDRRLLTPVADQQWITKLLDTLKMTRIAGDELKSMI
jgi:hypothetical protein